MTVVALIALVSLSAALVLWTYVGYPMVMNGLQRHGWRYGPARRQTSPVSVVTAAHDLPPVTIILVVYNAGEAIGAKLDSCLAQDYPPDRLSVLVYSDGSTDHTVAQVMQRQSDRVRLIRGAQRRGKAACLNDAIAASQTPILVLTDARQRIDAQAVRFLVGHFADPAVAAVSGALDIGPDVDEHDDDALGARVSDAVVQSAGDYWRLEKRLRAAEASVHSSVGVTGALYALRRSAYVPIPAHTILDDVLIPMNVVLAGHRVLFDWRARAFDAPSLSEAQERQRKIRTLAGNFQLFSLSPALFNPLRNPIWAQFLSHKMLRVIAPVPLLVLLLGSLALARVHPVFAGLFVVQVLAYALSVLPGGRARFWHMAPVRLVRGFLRLQWFAVLGYLWYRRNPQPQLWQITRHAVSLGAGPAGGEPRQ